MSHFIVTVLVPRPEGYNPAEHRTMSHTAIIDAEMEKRPGLDGFVTTYATAQAKQQAALAARPELVKQIEKEVERLLAPYDEDIKVPEYDRECYCIGEVAKSEAREHAAKTVGLQHFGDLRESFKEKRVPYPKGLWDKAYGEEKDEAAQKQVEEIDTQNDKLWKEHIKPYTEAEKAFFDAHPMKDRPDPTCGFYKGERQDWWDADAKEGDRMIENDGTPCGCGGTGFYKSTYNPKSKWDWYVIGGRWDGAIPGNMAPVEEVLALPDFKSYAVVTPDGEWHAKGKMGWWAISTNEVDSWPDQMRQLFEANRDCVAVAVDCHV